MSDSLQAQGLSPARLLCLWDSSGKNTGVVRHFLLQGIFPTRDWTSISYIPCIGRYVPYHLCHLGTHDCYSFGLSLNFPEEVFSILAKWKFLNNQLPEGAKNAMQFTDVSREEKVNLKVAQLWPTLWDPMDYTVHEILQARILEWVALPPGYFPNPGIEPRSPAIPFLQGIFLTKG